MKRWELKQNYTSCELQVSARGVVFKEYWDSSHDPNRSSASLADFIAGALHGEIANRIGAKELAEALAYAKTLASA